MTCNTALRLNAEAIAGWQKADRNDSGLAATRVVSSTRVVFVYGTLVVLEPSNEPSCL